MNETLLDRLAASKKYGRLCPDTLRRVVAECEGRYGKPKDLEKAVKERLHGISGAFCSPTEYRRLIEAAAAFDGSDDALLESVLRLHASTRERLPLRAMDALYDRIWRTTSMPESVLDLACGVNPFYLIARLPGRRVTGVDIDGDCAALADRLNGVTGRCADLLCENGVPEERYDVALLFKILPLLERQRAGSSLSVMNRVHARFLVVSFPTRTLGGRDVGMECRYAQWMESHLPDRRTIADRFVSGNELFFVLQETSVETP